MVGSQPGVKAGDGSMEDWKGKGKWLDLQEVLRSRKQKRVGPGQGEALVPAGGLGISHAMMGTTEGMVSSQKIIPLWFSGSERRAKLLKP